MGSITRRIIFGIVITSIILCVMTGCGGSAGGKVYGRRSISIYMDSAELCMNNNPEQAYRLLDSIDSRTIRNRALQARYALLYTEAQYKNYIDETNDSLIMIAVRYYSIRNDYLNRFRSYYSLGCIYSESGRFTDAAVALTEAERFVDCVDEYRAGLLYSQLGHIYSNTYDNSRAEKYYRNCVECYKNAGKEVHKQYAIYDLAACLIEQQLFDDADSLFREVQKWAINNDRRLYSNCLVSRLSCSLYSNSTDSAYVLINQYLSLFGEPYDDMPTIGLFAFYHIKMKDYDKAHFYLEKAWNSSLSASDSINLYYLNSLLAESENLAMDALAYHRNYTSLQNETLRKILYLPVLGAQKDYFQTLTEFESLKNIHNKTVFSLCIVISVLIIIIVLIYHHYQRKRMEEQLYDTLAVVEELTVKNRIHTDKIAQLKNEVIKQFHERHDVSNLLYSMYFDTDSQEKITRQQLIVIVKSMIKDYTSIEYIKNLDSFLDESYGDIMKRLSTTELGLTDKELMLFRFSLAGLSLKSISIIIKESTQNIYQIKSRVMKKIKMFSSELWEELDSLL